MVELGLFVVGLVLEILTHAHLWVVNESEDTCMSRMTIFETFAELRLSNRSLLGNHRFLCQFIKERGRNRQDSHHVGCGKIVNVFSAHGKMGNFIIIIREQKNVVVKAVSYFRCTDYTVLLLLLQFSCFCSFMLDVCSLLLPAFCWIKMNIFDRISTFIGHSKHRSWFINWLSCRSPAAEPAIAWTTQSANNY